MWIVDQVVQGIDHHVGHIGLPEDFQPLGKQGAVARHCDLEAERQANRKFIEIETTENNALFAEALGALGCEYALEGDKRLKTVLPQGVEVRDIYQVAADQQIRIRRLDYRRDSLKDIFLRAMEVNRGGV